MALTAYEQQLLSEADRQEIEKAKTRWSEAKAAGDTAGMQAANNYAEQIRRGYGFTGGTDGAGYNPVEGYEGLSTLKQASQGLDSAYQGVSDSYRAQAEAQKAELDKQRDNWIRQAYITNEKQKLGLDQQMRAQGISGGLSESSRVRLAQQYAADRSTAESETMKAKKDVELALQDNLAENELNRANARYNAGTAEAQFLHDSANNYRDIEQQKFQNDITKQQLEADRQQADLSKYMSFIQSGLVDDSSAQRIATSLGVSADAVSRASAAARNGDAQNMVALLLECGIYDPSFYELLGGRFSVETLQKYAELKRQQNAAASGSAGRSGGSATSSSVKSSGSASSSTASESIANDDSNTSGGKYDGYNIKDMMNGIPLPEKPQYATSYNRSHQALKAR